MKEDASLEEKLSLLFDFQLFEQEPELQSVIDAVRARFSSARELSDDEAGLVSAAGQPEAFLRKKPREKENDDFL